MTAAATAFRDFADLVAFPRRTPSRLARTCAAAMKEGTPDAARDLEAFADAAERANLNELQEAYTAAFDFDPACALELGWHLFGESFKRGVFLADLRDELARVGIVETEGLPDHLAHVLLLLEREPARRAAIASLFGPAISAVRSALAERQNPYFHLIAAVESFLAATR